MWCEQFSSCSQSYRSILVHVLVLGFLQGSHSGGGSSSCGGSGCSNRGRCSSSSRLGEIWGRTGVWWDAHPTRSSIRPSRVTLTRSTIKKYYSKVLKKAHVNAINRVACPLTCHQSLLLQGNWVVRTYPAACSPGLSCLCWGTAAVDFGTEESSTLDCYQTYSSPKDYPQGS